MAKGAICCRVFSIILLIAKLAVSAVLIRYAVYLDELINGALEKMHALCKVLEGSDCSAVGEEPMKIVHIVFLSIVVVVSVLMLFDLIGSIGASIGNKCMLCFYVVIATIMLILLLVPAAASAFLAVVAEKADNKFRGKFLSFTNESMHTIEQAMAKINSSNVVPDLKGDPPDMKQGRDEIFKKLIELDRSRNMTNGTNGIASKFGEATDKIAELAADISTKIKAIQDLINWIQEKLHCCGASSYNNWYRVFSIRRFAGPVSDVHWSLVRLSEGNGTSKKHLMTWDQECVFNDKPYICYVPKSCCKEDERDKFTNDMRCNQIHPSKEEIGDMDRINSKPCSEALMDHLHAMIVLLTILLCSLEGLMILTCISTCCARRRLIKEEKKEKKKEKSSKKEKKKKAIKDKKEESKKEKAEKVKDAAVVAAMAKKKQAQSLPPMQPKQAPTAKQPQQPKVAPPTPSKMAPPSLKKTPAPASKGARQPPPVSPDMPSYTAASSTTGSNS